MRKPRRPGITKLEVVVIFCCLFILVALLLMPAVQTTYTSKRTLCRNNLKQLGLAISNYQDTYKVLPPGMLANGRLTDGSVTGFTLLLPYMEEKEVYESYNAFVSWGDPRNHTACGKTIATFLCPSNPRTSLTMDLRGMSADWDRRLPESAGSVDYAFCKGACSGFSLDPSRIPHSVRGVFDVNSRTRITDITDGLATTIALGEAAAGPGSFQVRDLATGKAVIHPRSGQAEYLCQPWSAAAISDASHPYYGSVFAVAAQRANIPADPRPEPPIAMSGLIAPTFDGADDFQNTGGRSWVSGFRCFHPNMCHFLLCDGSVKSVNEKIDPVVFQRMSSYADGGKVPEEE